ncbi:MAG: DUF1761 domain-containing protein [Weeksellaceae bacterium]
MDLNIMAVVVATIAQFVVGAIWYTPLFGKLWGQIHGFDKLSKAVQDKMVKEMGPYYGLQLLVTIFTSIVMGMLVADSGLRWSVFMLAALIWIGFVVPAQVSSVIFGGTDAKWLWKKIAVQAGGSLACLEAAALVFYLMG